MVISTSYFPDLEWFYRLQNGALIEAHENYQKQTPRNHCRIMTAQGVAKLSVPIVQPHRPTAVRDIRVDYTLPWQRTHCRTLVAAYASAPYFSHFWAEIEPLFGQRHDFLFDLNLSYAQQMARLLKISAPFSLTDDFMGITPSEGFQVEPYYQVFSPVIPFVGGLSVLDFLFCENSWRARSE